MRLIIKDKENNRINPEVLDVDIAKLWNKELSKHYANPTPKFTNPDKLSGIELVKAEVEHEFNEKINWYDFIKYTSDTFPEGQIKYLDLMNRMFQPIMFLSNAPKIADGFAIDCEHQEKYIKPYFDVLEMWYEKGYTIHNVL